MRQPARSQPTRQRERVGRKPKLTKEIADKLVSLLKAGCVISVACSAVGIGERTFHRWMEQGRLEQRGPYWQFRQLVEHARAHREIALVASLHKHAMKDWRAAAWMLEQMFPTRYSTRVLTALCEAARQPDESPCPLVINLPKIFDQPRIPLLPADGKGHGCTD